MHAANSKQRPKAQEAANLVWALATMHHAAATAELFDLLCEYFAGLTQESDAQLCPNAQNVANVMWALAEAKHSPTDGRLLDDFYMYMHGLLGSKDQRVRPNAQDVANSLWSLAELKHTPSDQVVSAMLDHFLGLCQTPGLQPKAHDISNIFIACAELRFSMRQDQVKLMFKQLLGLPESKAVYQVYCNFAYSLAVMGLLDISMFDCILDKLVAKHSQLLRKPGTRSIAVQPKEPGARQLHQAAEYLKPAQDSEQMEGWCSLHSR